jgi:hypothetical protein
MIHVIASDIQSHYAVRRKACRATPDTILARRPPTEWQHIGKLDQRRDDLCVVGFRKRAWKT